MLSTAIRLAFFSSSEVTNPHRSTVPSRTVTLSIDGRHNCAFNRESTLSRICESPALAAAAFFHAGKRLKQVCAADDSHHFSILHDRHPLDAISFQQHRNL